MSRLPRTITTLVEVFSAHDLRVEEANFDETEGFADMVCQVDGGKL